MGADQITIDVCGEQHLRSALELVLQSLPADQRGPLVESLARLAQEPLGAFDALTVALREGNVVASAWAQPQPGRTASLWLPKSDGEPLADLAKPLIERALLQADLAGVELSQSLLEPGDEANEQLLVECGFQRLAELEYLGWTGKEGRTSPPSPSPELSLEQVDSGDKRRLERVVAGTYVKTLDCPELDGMRNMSDVLAGYRLTGDHDPGLWFYLRSQETDAGVLLLTEHKASAQLELMYMGIRPEARGLGLGRCAVAAAQAIAGDRSADRLVLAVDSRNEPAKRIYLQAGFQSWANRIVFARSRPRV